MADSGSQMRCTDELRAGWVAFLAHWSWEWFASFTFRGGPLDANLARWGIVQRGDVHPEAADKLFRLLVSKGNRMIHGPRWHSRGLGISWARALEWQRRGVVHYHALMGGVGNLRRLGMMDIWNDLAGFSRIEAPRRLEAVKRYCSKYVVKGGQLDLGGPWFQGAHPPKTRGQARRLRGWFDTPLGQKAALRRLRELTTPQERQQLLEWASGKRSRRASEALITEVRERAWGAR